MIALDSQRVRGWEVGRGCCWFGSCRMERRPFGVEGEDPWGFGGVDGDVDCCVGEGELFEDYGDFPGEEGGRGKVRRVFDG